MRRFLDHPKRPDPALLLTLLLLFLAAAVGGVSLLDNYGTFERWRYPPLHPLTVEATVPKRAPVKLMPQGATLSRSGLLTILRVSPTPAEPRPIIYGKPIHSPSPAGPDLDPAVAGGIRAFFKTQPLPRDHGLTTTTMEYKHTQLRLVLVEGCFRADGPSGPLVVFPPGARLFVAGGYLSVGVSKSPDAEARVGEELYWEAYAPQISEPKSLGIIHSICGPGAVLQVTPSSASVFASRMDSAAAMNFQRASQGVGWAGAVSAVKACDRRMEASIRRYNPGAREVHVSNVCGSALVNPPNPGNCPAGTRFERGNCLAEKGPGVPTASPPVLPQP